MKIRVLGAGFYGCHIARALLRDGHSVEVHEIAPHIFAGASGAIPARLHIGCHYPRSRLTRAACLDHREAFMAEYGFLTRAVPVNLYAIAANHSLVDLDGVLDDIFGFADDHAFVFLAIACRPAKHKRLPDGRDVHVTIKPPKWWDAKLEKYKRDGLTIRAVYDEAKV